MLKRHKFQSAGDGMKHITFLVALLVFALVAITASAAQPTPYDWTGFYIGAQGGGAGWGHTDWKYAASGTKADQKIRGGFGGPFAGYNYEFANQIVAGLETEGNFGSISGHTPCPNPAFTCSSEVTWFGSTRARAGFALDRFFPYFAAGVAYGAANINTTLGSSKFGGSNSYLGWALSPGLEFAITNNIIARAQYAYYDLGHKTATVDNGLRVKTHIDFHAVQFGVSFKF